MPPQRPPSSVPTTKPPTSVPVSKPPTVPTVPTTRPPSVSAPKLPSVAAINSASSVETHHQQIRKFVLDLLELMFIFLYFS